MPPGRRSTISEVESQVPTDGPKTSTSLLSGTGTLFASRMVVAALGWAGSLLIFRRLSPNDWGSFSFIFNLLGLLGLVADFQTSRVVVGEVLEAGDDVTGLVGSFVAFRIALGAAMYVLAIAFVVIGGYPHLVIEGVMVGGL
ncbi:MAG: hypothetical protein QOI42_2, partial [Frankiaceae bacterium]|nr:hypothetical protein [Frankiaceae bacterium]